MNRQATFKQADVKRALQGVVAAGIQPKELLIDPDGRIRINLGAATDANEEVADEIARHFATR
jgi:hypothetical protein